MIKKSYISIMVCLLLFTTGSVLAQNKMAIEIMHTGNDPVGLRLVYNIKEDIRKSAGLRLTTIDEPRLVLHITTGVVAGAASETSFWAFAITCDKFFKVVGLNKGEIFIGLRGGITPANDVYVDAETLVAHLDKEANDIKTLIIK